MMVWAMIVSWKALGLECKTLTKLSGHIGEAVVRNKRYYDVRVKPATYQVGQWVYYFNPRRYKGRQDNGSRKYTGPFCVVRVLGPVNVELQQTKRSRPFIEHIVKVKPYLGDLPKGWVENKEVKVNGNGQGCWRRTSTWVRSVTLSMFLFLIPVSRSCSSSVTVERSILIHPSP